MITKWLNSLKTYSLSVLFTHFIIFTYFFPAFVFYIIVCSLMIAMFWAWCDLIYYIEQSERNHILGLIDTCTSDQTKDILVYQLILHDQNSAFGNPIHPHG
jgi:hypothetical protein